jgi:methionyl aminopeptidase
MSIRPKSQKEIEAMREGAKLLAGIMKELGKCAKPGINTLDLDKLAERQISDIGGRPSFKGYQNGDAKPYPATICASLNDEVVHGIPKKSVVLKDGDLLKIDIGMKYKGMHTDMARTFSVGNADLRSVQLIKITERSFWEGIKGLKSGIYLSIYSKKVQKFIEKNGFSVVRNLVGHGVGKALHEPPQIPNYYNGKYHDVKLISGMALALEPMVNEGSFETILGRDGWVFKTKDGKLSAHYENTIVITDKGVEVLTI